MQRHIVPKKQEKELVKKEKEEKEKNTNYLKNAY